MLNFTCFKCEGGIDRLAFCPECKDLNAPLWICVTIKSVYGKETIYPACDKSALFAAVAGTKTLTRETVGFIKKMGFEVHVEPNEVRI
jgi:hypothetical protein